MSGFVLKFIFEWQKKLIRKLCVKWVYNHWNRKKKKKKQKRAIQALQIPQIIKSEADEKLVLLCKRKTHLCQLSLSAVLVFPVLPLLLIFPVTVFPALLNLMVFFRLAETKRWTNTFFPWGILLSVCFCWREVVRDGLCLMYLLEVFLCAD